MIRELDENVPDGGTLRLRSDRKAEVLRPRFGGDLRRHGVLRESDRLPKDGSATHADLFALYHSLEDALVAYDMGAEVMTSAACADEITAAQDLVMRLALERPARNVEDAAYKLALWRWDGSELDGCNASRGEAVAASLLADLAALADCEDVLPSLR